MGSISNQCLDCMVLWNAIQLPDSALTCALRSHMSMFIFLSHAACYDEV